MIGLILIFIIVFYTAHENYVADNNADNEKALEYFEFSQAQFDSIQKYVNRSPTSVWKDSIKMVLDERMVLFTDNDTIINNEIIPKDSIIQNDSAMIVDSLRLKDEQIPGETIDADALAFINAIGTLTETQQNAIVDLVEGLKTNGTWAKYHVIYPVIGGTSSTHKFNLKDPRNVDAANRLQFFGTITHDADGMQGDGSSGWANTYFNASTGFASKDNTTFMAYINDNDAIANAAYPTMMGAYTNNSYAYSMDLKVEGSTKSVGFRNTGSWSGYTSPTTVKGLWTMTRNNSLDTQLYQNTNLFRTETQSSSTGLPNQNLLLWNQNQGSDTTHSLLWSVRRMAFVAFGDGLSSTEIANDYAVIEAYQDALGRGVN